MENTNEELKAHLLASDEEYRRLAEEHARYHKELEELEAKSPLVTDRDEVEEHRLKKLKLNIKDQMNQIIARHATAQQVA